MKKELIICIVVIFLVGVLNSITDSYTKSTIADIKNNLSIIKKDIEDNKEKEKIKEDILNTRSSWDDKNKTLAYYIEHDELEKVTLYLVGLESNVSTEEYSQAMEELDKCVYILEHIEDKYDFNLKNIF